MPAVALPQQSQMPRAKALAIDCEHVRSSLRKGPRERSREIAQQAMNAERALICDVAEALGVNERLASRAIRGEAPIDLGDLLALAISGRGGARLARRVAALIVAEIDRIELAAHEG